MDEMTNRPKSNNKTGKFSSTPSCVTAVRMLDMAMSKTGKNLTAEESVSWREILEKHPPEAIEYAFKAYFRTPPQPGQSKWFPEEWQILEILRNWHEQRRLTQTEPALMPPLASEEEYAAARKGIKEVLQKIDMQKERRVS
jgi:hypothetical protein